MSIFVVNDSIWLATCQSKIYEKYPPSKVAKSAFMGTLIEQPPHAQIRSNAKYLCAHQIANDKTFILSTKMAQKSILGQSYGVLKNGVAKLAKIP